MSCKLNFVSFLWIYHMCFTVDLGLFAAGFNRNRAIASFLVIFPWNFNIYSTKSNGNCCQICQCACQFYHYFKLYIFFHMLKSKFGRKNASKSGDHEDLDEFKNSYWNEDEFKKCDSRQTAQLIPKRSEIICHTVPKDSNHNHGQE